MTKAAGSDDNGRSGPRKPAAAPATASSNCHSEAPATNPPNSIVAAFVIWSALGACLVILGILDLILITTEPAGGHAPGTGMVLGAVVLFLASGVHGGRNWARISLIIFSAFFNIFPLVTVSGFSFSSSYIFLLDRMAMTIISSLFAAVAILGIILMFTPTANSYFNKLRLG